MRESNESTERRPYAPPKVRTETLPILPLVELSSGGTPGGGSFGKFRGPPGSKPAGS